MKLCIRRFRVGVIALAAITAACASYALANEFRIVSRAAVGNGWRPWYELKSDPDDANRLMVCGTQWDAQENAAWGFVDISDDGGRSWRAVLEDRHSSWVTEQSCAFGPSHKAYFLSEASKVIDGVPHHLQGATRLYVSADGGLHWTESLKTGWADWSTSAVSQASGKLLTFFNSSSTIAKGRRWGSNVGLLIFSANGKSATGPFFEPRIQNLGYAGIYPSYAIALKSGTVVALYHALKDGGQNVDLGLIRASGSPEPTMDSTIISHTSLGQGCPLADKGSLAYDARKDRLYALYGDGCGRRRPMLAYSDDEGRTWAKPVHILTRQKSNPRYVIVDPSLDVAPNGLLALLWQSGRCSGRWLFSVIRNGRLVLPPVELSTGITGSEVSNDSLSSWTAPPGLYHDWGLDAPFDVSITLSIYGMLNNVWRGAGLIARNHEFLAVWASGNKSGMQLHSAALGLGNAHGPQPVPSPQKSETDVTQHATILYAGNQHFDDASGRLNICVTVANRSEVPFMTPVWIEAEKLKSGVGEISVLNSTNRVLGAGAMWDISRSITGDRIPSRAKSNPFCLSFRLDIRPGHQPTHDVTELLTMKLKVLASSRRASGH